MNWKDQLSRGLSRLSRTITQGMTGTRTAPPPDVTAPPPDATTPPPDHAPAPAHATPTDYQPGDVICEEYEVAEVKRGGMGAVYLCGGYALKTLPVHMLHDSRRLAQLDHEVQTWISLGAHLNIVRCYALRVDTPAHMAPVPFILLEQIIGSAEYGDSLYDWLRFGPVEPQQALDFLIGICTGLVYASQQQPGLVHRDLKPQNILVKHGQVPHEYVQYGEDGDIVDIHHHIEDIYYAKITDFGIATIAEQAEQAEQATVPAAPRKGSTAGTPDYMAPEQWRGEPLDPRTDIYAVGCILYELCTGRRPYLARTREALRDLHCDAPMPRLPASTPLAAELNPVLARCMAKRPEDRFANAEAVLETLTHIYQQAFAAPPRQMAFFAKKTIETIEIGRMRYDSYVERAQTYQRLQNYAAALNEYTHALELLYAADAEGRAIAGEYYQIDYKLPLTLCRRGLLYAQMGEYDRALAEFQQAIDYAPEYFWTYQYRGETYRTMQRYDAALADLTHAIEMCGNTPTSPDGEPSEIQQNNLAELYDERGSIYSRMQQYAAALEDFTRAIAQHPNPVTSAHVHRGIVSHELRAYANALADFNRFIEYSEAHSVRLDSRMYYYRGHTLLALQRYAEALPDYDRFIASDLVRETRYEYELGIRITQADHPEHQRAEALTARGSILKELQRHEEALQDFERAIALYPDYASAYHQRGMVCYDLDRYEEALADYARAIALDPENALVYYNRGLILQRREQYDAALADYTQALAHDTGMEHVAEHFKREHLYYNRGLSLQMRGQHDAALADYAQAIAIDPGCALAYLNRGTIWLHQGHYAAALAETFRVLELEPDNAQAHYNLGLISAELHDEDAALASYTRAIACDPTLLNAAINRGNISRTRGDYAAAMADYQHVLEHAPDYVLAYCNRGMLYDTLGDTAAALDDFSHAIALQPDKLDAYIERSRLLLQMGQYDAAIADTSYILELDSNYAMAANNQGAAFFALGDYAAALTDLSHAIALDPQFAMAYNNRGSVYHALEHYDAALTDFAQAIACDPAYALAYFKRGITYYARDDYAAALDDFTQALRLVPDWADAYVNCGGVYQTLERYPEALHAYAEALRIAPDHAVARDNWERLNRMPGNR